MNGWKPILFLGTTYFELFLNNDMQTPPPPLSEKWPILVFDPNRCAMFWNVFKIHFQFFFNFFTGLTTHIPPTPSSPSLGWYQRHARYQTRHARIFFFRSVQIYMQNPESAESKEKPNFRFLFFELWSLLYSKCPQFSMNFIPITRKIIYAENLYYVFHSIQHIPHLS